MKRIFARIIRLLVLLIACNPANVLTAGQNVGRAPGRSARGLVEGRDYVVLARARLLDEMAFDRPVEAMSVLVPRGWRTEGGVRWNGVGGCRGEIVTWQMSVTSPDGAIRYLRLPERSFVFYQDQMLQQGALAAARQGGCQVNPPFNAAQYLNQLARAGLGGATVSNIRIDESLQPMLQMMDANANAASRQYGTGLSQSSSAVYGTLTWPDGSKGLAQVGVTAGIHQGRDMYTGAPNGYASTTVFHQVVIRYPPAREAEALKLFGTIGASYRMSPIWKQAKDAFLTRLGNMEHAGRMERLRLQGEQARAYARAQSEASDARMRDWERSQASSDAGQHRYIQTIREVETWRDGSGSPVELGAGYSHGWSRPDGSIILTNNSLFDPAVEFQENWSRMSKQPQ